MRADSPIFNHLPIHLRGEIIEIGAVKLDENILKTASKAGLKMIMWGLESGSDKIMKSMLMRK